MEQQRKVLVVIKSAKVLEAVKPLLRRFAVEADRIRGAAGALTIAGKAHYDLILAEYPLPGLELEDFLRGLRRGSSCSKSTPLLLLTQAADVDAVAGRPGADQVQAISLQQPAPQIQEAISNVLGVAPRASSRLLVQLQLTLNGSPMLRVCQCTNLSESGMLVRSSRLLPVGSEIQLSFSLPEDPREIAALGRIVRHSGPKDQVEGMGLTFLKIESEARDRLRDFLAQKSRPAEPPEERDADPEQPTAAAD